MKISEVKGKRFLASLKSDRHYVVLVYNFIFNPAKEKKENKKEKRQKRKDISFHTAKKMK